MMTSWEIFTFVNAFELAAMAGLLWYMWTINSILHSRISNHATIFNDYRLEVAEKYVSTAALRSVEERLTKAIDGLGLDLRALTKVLNEQAVASVEYRNEQRAARPGLGRATDVTERGRGDG